MADDVKTQDPSTDSTSSPQADAQDDAKAPEEVKPASTEVDSGGEAAEKVEEAAEEVKNEGDPSTDAQDDAGASEAVEEAKEAVEEVKAEEKPAEPAKEEKKPEPSGKFKNIIKDIESLSALELSELVKALEERFGVSAAAPVAVAGAVPAAGAAEGGDEEKSNYTVVLTNGGGNKIAAIKALREVSPELGLAEAKDVIEGAPKTIKENVPTEDAKGMKEKLEAAGATVELK